MAQCHLNLCMRAPIMSSSPHRPRSPDMISTISIRPSRPSEQAALNDLAGLDSARPLEGDVLVAIVDDAPVAAISLDDGRVIADPFRRTAATAKMLKPRAGVGGPGARAPPRPRAPLRARLGLAASSS